MCRYEFKVGFSFAIEKGTRPVVGDFQVYLFALRLRVIVMFAARASILFSTNSAMAFSGLF